MSQQATQEESRKTKDDGIENFEWISDNFTQTGNHVANQLWNSFERKYLKWGCDELNEEVGNISKCLENLLTKLIKPVRNEPNWCSNSKHHQISQRVLNAFNRIPNKFLNPVHCHDCLKEAADDQWNNRIKHLEEQTVLDQ